MEIQASLASALLKSAALARDLIQAGFRPDHMPSAAGRTLARTTLRIRDVHADVTEAVEAQLRDAGTLGRDAARLLGLARAIPCPDPAQAFAYLALLVLIEARERLQGTRAEADEAMGPSPPSAAAPEAHAAPANRAPWLRRVHMPDPAIAVPGEPTANHD